MKRYLKILAIIIVMAGIWMCFWDPIEAVTNALGPVWSFIIGIGIIVLGSYIGVKAF